MASAATTSAMPLQLPTNRGSVMATGETDTPLRPAPSWHLALTFTVHPLAPTTPTAPANSYTLVTLASNVWVVDGVVSPTREGALVLVT